MLALNATSIAETMMWMIRTFLLLTRPYFLSDPTRQKILPSANTNTITISMRHVKLRKFSIEKDIRVPIQFSTLLQ